MVGRNRSTGMAKTFLVFMVIGALALAGYFAWAGGMFRSKEKIAIVSGNDSPFWDEVFVGAQDAAKACGVELVVIKVKFDEAAQSAKLRELLNAGVQGIAVSPNNDKAQLALLNEIADKVALITFDSDAPTSKRKYFIGTDDYAAGSHVAAEVEAAVPQGGKVIITVGAIDRENGRLRRQGLIDSLTGRPFSRTGPTSPVNEEVKGPKYTIAATVLDGGDRDKASTLLTEALKAHPDTVCVVGLFGYNTPAILKSLAEVGKLGKVKVVGFDAAEETQRGMEAGHVYATILQDQYRCGYETVRVLASAVRGIDEHGPRGARLLHLPIAVVSPNDLERFRQEGKIPSVKGATTQPAK